QTLHATRTLPYATPAIYAIIADVPRYAAFVPYCQDSVVTRWSRPDGVTGARWPAEATLSVGWNALREDFASRIYCAPPRPEQSEGTGRAGEGETGEGVVEAVAGASRSRFSPAHVPHHDLQHERETGAPGTLLTHLLTRWSVKPVPTTSTTSSSSTAAQHSQVSLDIEFAFANPLYQAMSAAATPHVAGKMIEAFERRVEEVLGGGA
ncbi:uncharacterized protein K452DRAFT_194769, partial [Aplosporella prunicola CBS 121167]